MYMNGATVHFEPKPDLRAEAETAAFKFLRMCFIGVGRDARRQAFYLSARDVLRAVNKLRDSGEEW